MLSDKSQGAVPTTMGTDEKYADPTPTRIDSRTEEEGITTEVTYHGVHRSLNSRQVQLIAIGGTIGTAVFLSMGSTLYTAGPGALLLAFAIYSFFIGLINNCIAETTVYMPVSAAFIRHAGHWVDDAAGFAAGWNFFLYEGFLIPFEIVAFTQVLGFWSDNIPPAAICVACIVTYALINFLGVKYYGEAEFWLSIGKVFLIMIVFAFTLVTMSGGNPQKNAYGFTNWNNPGAFKEYLNTGTNGKFQGFLSAVWRAAFTVVGPEYVSMVAGEVKNPRPVLKSAFKTMYVRFGLFFIGSALCIGIVISANDPTLVAINEGTAAGSGTGAASPYVIAMKNMGIEGLPHLVNALLCTSIFSAGNTYVFCASRTLHGLALDGHAPRFFRYCNSHGVPVYCLILVMIFPLLSFLQVSSASIVVLNWLINLVTAGGLINYIVMSSTYIFFYRACIAQGIDRNTLPYKGWGQPYCAYIGLAWVTTVVFAYGYSVFLPGAWFVGDFFIYYALLILLPINFFGWKLFKKTKLIKPLECDLKWEIPIIEQHEADFLGLGREDLTMLQSLKKMIGGKKGRGHDVAV